jgi:hypothetical protein
LVVVVVDSVVVVVDGDSLFVQAEYTRAVDANSNAQRIRFISTLLFIISGKTTMQTQCPHGMCFA